LAQGGASLDIAVDNMDTLTASCIQSTAYLFVVNVIANVGQWLSIRCQSIRLNFKLMSKTEKHEVDMLARKCCNQNATRIA
jgi:hypothetical protein